MNQQINFREYIRSFVVRKVFYTGLSSSIFLTVTAVLMMLMADVKGVNYIISVLVIGAAVAAGVIEDYLWSKNMLNPILAECERIERGNYVDETACMDLVEEYFAFPAKSAYNTIIRWIIIVPPVVITVAAYTVLSTEIVAAVAFLFVISALISALFSYMISDRMLGRIAEKGLLPAMNNDEQKIMIIGKFADTLSGISAAFVAMLLLVLMFVFFNLQFLFEGKIFYQKIESSKPAVNDTAENRVDEKNISSEEPAHGRSVVNALKSEKNGSKVLLSEQP